MELTQHSYRLTTSPQVKPEDLRQIAADGFAGIVNNRPDAEGPEQPTSLELEAEAKRLGLAYWHIPVVPGEMTDKDVRAFAAALEAARGPVLAFCRTGNRAAALWKASQARRFLIILRPNGLQAMSEVNRRRLRRRSIKAARNRGSAFRRGECSNALLMLSREGFCCVGRPARLRRGSSSRPISASAGGLSKGGSNQPTASNKSSSTGSLPLARPRSTPSANTRISNLMRPLKACGRAMCKTGLSIGLNAVASSPPDPSLFVRLGNCRNKMAQ